MVLPGRRAVRGMTLIDVLVGIFITLSVFTALFGMLRGLLVLSTISQTQAGANAIADSEIEYLRSLSYDSVGTVGGIPSGVVVQNATTTLNGVIYATNVFIEYIDDPADGSGASDTNGIITDYKRARVGVTYTVAGQAQTSIRVTNIAPPNIETTTGGGTLRINVVNASGVAVAGATVNITNSNTSPAIGLTASTDASGIVYLPGAPAATGYQVTVSRAGYSTAQTYGQTAQNTNPSPGHLTVAVNQTTTSTFAIDTLGTIALTAQTLETPTASSTPISGASFTLSGTKTIGSGAGGAPVYKTSDTEATDGTGAKSVPLEWDSYSLTVPSYDIIDACPAPPFALAPGTTITSALTLGAKSTNALLVSVEDNAGVAVAGATVTLTRTGFSDTETASVCGNAYFGSLSANTYTVTISKTGYTTTPFSNVSVSGATTYAASFP